MSPSGSLPEPRDVSRYVPTEVDDARATRLWQGVRRRAPRATRGVPRRWPRLAAVVLVAAAAAAIALFAARRTAFERRVASVEYDRSGSMTLADGSRIHLREDGRVRLERFDARLVELTLEQGSADFDVVHVAGRSFVVHAGRVDVVDVGTRFVVTRRAGGTGVVVEEGRVEVRDPAGALPARTLVAGESWSSEPTGVPMAAPSSTATTSAAADASASAGPEAPSATAPATTAAAVPRAPTAKALLEAADRARVAGRTRDAAALLDVLRRRHRRDPRAGLAAFELGRLRLESLGDPAGAVEAFDDAIALGPNAPFREDAEARRVEALERAHDPRCREARDAYLARYPKGIHVVEVTARCYP